MNRRLESSKPSRLPRQSLVLTWMPAGLLGGVGSIRAAADLAPALVDLPDHVALVSDPGQPGQWVQVRSDAPFSEKDFVLGRMPALGQFATCFRGRSACWMESRVGGSVAEVPAETQFMLVRQTNGNYLAMIAMVDGAFRSSLSGGADGRLHVLAESGDTQTTTNQVICLYMEEGRDPFMLIHSATARVRIRLHPGEVDPVPQLPDFARYFGWCSWNAFYTKVSSAGVMQVMQKFEEGGVSPGFVVLDDGWQSSADNMLTGYEANPQRFPDGLAITIRMLKQTNHVARVLAWHAFNGYWRGTDPKTLPALGIQMVTPHLPPIFTSLRAALGDENEAALPRKFYPAGYRKPIGEPDLGKFFSAFHAFLREQGVDGVKIDAMTWVETLGEGRGGRVQAMRELVAATTRSEHEQFDHNIIWCSSCSSDCILQAPRSAVMRTSCDFFPDKPESHGRHIINNALNSLWMGEFVIPDWDMFQSHHAAGAFHAAARAISGGPVYISGSSTFVMGS